MAVCVAIIGKENAPKFIRCTDRDQELDFHYKVHSSLDIIEEKLLAASHPKATEPREQFLGMLYATEEHKIYGYVTNTKMKIIIVIDANHQALRDNEIRAMFRKLHGAYADAVCNPFYIPGDQVTSKKFTETVLSLLVKS
ncbi:trafficking protein particle complex subunit 2-like protein-like [Nesidiocoris tenuis]|uniref:Trafficking protein particle complex subunit 2-like protein n=1 Tax=Nesidiocoris tenuis TaxID=355587 RepID=A0ABN7B6H7_9HEMI|nr:trafficking protein particle complex subunit 2-like protein-like [Nesidiocoris tenuis]